MLTKMIIKNLRSICSAEIDFTKSAIEYRDGNILNGLIVNPLALYGENGTGKSTLLKVFQYLSVLMTGDKKVLDAIDFIPNIFDIEKLQKKKVDTINSPYIEMHFITSEGLSFIYSISSASSTIFSEKLMFKNKKLNSFEELLVRERKTFRVKGDTAKVDISSDYSAVRKIGLEEYSEDKKEMIKIKKCYEQLSKLIFIDARNNIFGDFTNKITVQDALSSTKYNIAEKIVKFSNMPVFTFKKDKDEKGSDVLIGVFDKDEKLPFSFFSAGVVNESRILLALELASRDKDFIVAIDEIDSSIHPISLKKIVNEYKTLGIQLIFSSHDTTLLKFLRPDQIYFAHYNKELCSNFKRLNVIYPSIREINNIESMYLKGVFDKFIKND